MSRAWPLVLLAAAASCSGTQNTSAASSSSPGGVAAAPTSSVESGVNEPEPGGPPKELDCGDFTTCAIATDGIARCWGRDKNGELGDGAGTGARLRRGAVPGIGKVKKIALASEFGCAVLEDKKVKCWGTGRIANDGALATNAKPTDVNGVEDVDELVASGAIACARSSKGLVTCWGATEKAIGQAPKDEVFKQITAGFTHACGLSKMGAVTCWGPGDWGGVFAKPAITGASEVVSGDRHACVILAKDKSVMCWGMNDAGQLGMKSDTEPHKKPVPVKGLSNVVHLAAGEASTCALSTDGTVRCWGANGEGELGLGKRSPDERPAKVSALGSNVDQICLASAHGCALTKQNKLLCWGANAFGQLGDGTKDRRPSPTPVAW